jgi:hypothetical protein
MVRTPFLAELLSPEFVSSHTKFANADEMFESSGFKIESQDDFSAIPDAEWDEFIRSISSFSDWQSMLGETRRLRGQPRGLGFDAAFA